MHVCTINTTALTVMMFAVLDSVALYRIQFIAETRQKQHTRTTQLKHKQNKLGTCYLQQHGVF